MFCENCGTKSEIGSKFCDQCGAKIGASRQEEFGQNLERNQGAGFNAYPREYRHARSDETELVDQSEPIRDSEIYGHEDYTASHEYTAGYYEEEHQPDESKKKNKKPLIIILGALLLVTIAVTGWLFMGFQNTRAFNDAMDQAHRYLLEENLEQAEAHFLRAIDINPREVEPYLRLADIYMEWDEPDRAIEILEQGREAVSEEDRLAIDDALAEILERDEDRPPVPDEDMGETEDGDEIVADDEEEEVEEIVEIDENWRELIIQHIQNNEDEWLSYYLIFSDCNTPVLIENRGVRPGWIQSVSFDGEQLVFSWLARGGFGTVQYIQEENLLLVELSVHPSGVINEAGSHGHLLIQTLSVGPIYDREPHVDPSGDLNFNSHLHLSREEWNCGMGEHESTIQFFRRITMNPRWEREEITEAEHQRLLNEAFDFSRATKVEWEDWMSADEMIEKIMNL